MKTLRQELVEDVQSYAMSFEEIEKVLKGRVKGLHVRFLYEKTHNFKNLWSKGVNVCFTLLELGSLKHWVVFSKKWMYDPLGNSPDFFKEKWSRFWKVVKDKDWNRHVHEKSSAKIQSCGEHCLVRTVKYHLGNEEFHKWLNSVMPGQSDLLVSALVYIGVRNFV